MKTVLGIQTLMTVLMYLGYIRREMTIEHIFGTLVCYVLLDIILMIVDSH